MAASARPRDLLFQVDLSKYFGESWWANGRSDYLLVIQFLPDTRGIWICLFCGFFLHVSPNTCNKKCGSTIIFSDLCKYRDKLNTWLVSWGFPREVPSRLPWRTDCWSDEYRQTIVNNNFYSANTEKSSWQLRFCDQSHLRAYWALASAIPLKK